MVTVGLIKLVIYVYVYSVSILTMLEITGFMILIYKLIKRCLPYFSTDAYNSIPIVISFEAILDFIRKIAVSEVFLVWVLLLLILLFIYLIYYLIFNFAPEQILFFPFRKRLLDNILFVELNKSGLFPLLDRVFAALASKKKNTSIARTIVDDIGNYTKNVFDDLKKYVENTNPQTAMSTIKSLSNVDNGNNDDEREIAKEYVYSNDHSAEENAKFETDHHKCIDKHWVDTSEIKFYPDRIRAMVMNNAMVTFCNINSAIAMNSVNRTKPVK